MKKIIFSILIGLFFVYLSVRGIDFQGVVAGFAKINYGYAALFLVIAVIMQLIRTWRWGLILSPLEKVAFRPLWTVTNVGFLAITALPARIGELGRPYLLSRTTPVRMSAAMGTILMERILDGASLVVIAFLAALSMPLPPWLMKATIIFFLLTAGMILFVLFIVFRRKAAMKVINPIVNFFAARWGWGERLNRAVQGFMDGFGVILNMRDLFYILSMSFALWIIDALAIYVMFMTFNLKVPAVAALILMIILIIGIAIPTAPGFIGNWHFACVIALSFFGIPKTEALTFAIVYHFLSISIIIVLGLTSLSSINFSFADLWKQAKSV